MMIFKPMKDMRRQWDMYPLYLISEWSFMSYFLIGPLCLIPDLSFIYVMYTCLFAATSFDSRHLQLLQLMRQLQLKPFDLGSHLL